MLAQISHFGLARSTFSKEGLKIFLSAVRGCEGKFIKMIMKDHKKLIAHHYPFEVSFVILYPKVQSVSRLLFRHNLQIF